MLIGEKEFRFVSRITLETDNHGHILEESPAARYNNVKNLRLHKHGGGSFCRFKIKSLERIDGLGVYGVIEEGGKLLYIGKCTGLTSTLLKRFNYGYGRIQPRNCYEGGQSTNCRINRLVLEAVKNGKMLSVFFHETQTGQDATALEADLIRQLGKPTWNINEPW